MARKPNSLREELAWEIYQGMVGSDGYSKTQFMRALKETCLSEIVAGCWSAANRVEVFLPNESNKDRKP